MKPWVRMQMNHGRPYYYFRRRNLLINVRLPDPDSPEFDAAYERAVAASTLEDVLALRAEMNMMPIKRKSVKVNEITQAIMDWAERKPLSERQVELLQECPLKLTREEALRGRLDVRQNPRLARKLAPGAKPYRFSIWDL